MKQAVDNFTPDLFVTRSCDRLLKSDAKSSARAISVGGFQSSDKRSTMNAQQVQDYITLVLSKVEQLGEHYVSSQFDWAVAELERIQGAV